LVTIGIDVDLTIVRSDLEWIRWLSEAQNDVEFTYDNLVDDYGWGNVPYDLTKIVSYGCDEGVDPMNFWKSAYLYDHMKPIAGAVNIIQRWKDQGHKIVFISSCKGHHEKSKYNFIKRNFNPDGVIFTREKHFVDVDVMIDDRLDVLEKFKPKTATIQFDTPYLQSITRTPSVVVKDWYELKRLEI
jgi:5'(3')-deoxyribonucleotidase